MSWHCAPLKSEGAFSLSGNPMRGKPQSVSNQKGSSSCLQSENCWSQSPICWPMVTVSNLSTRTNNRWLAYQPVIIARWYIISVSCNDHNSFQHLEFIHYLNHNLCHLSPTQHFVFSIPNVPYFQSKSLSNTLSKYQLHITPSLSITIHQLTYQRRCHSTTPIYIPLFQKNHNHQTGYYVYI